MAQTTQMTDHFSLAHFLRALEGFEPPDEAFDPTGAWGNAYQIFECSQGMRAQGTLRISREPAGRDGLDLKIEHTKRAVGGSLRFDVEMLCAADDLATPRRWTTNSVALDPDGAPIEDTRLVEAGRAVKGGVRIETHGRNRKIDVPAPFAYHWGLFDAIQRMKPEADTIREFTLLDRLSYQVKPGHRLAFRGSAEVELGGRKVWHETKEDLEIGTLYRPVAAREGAVASKLHAWEQYGEGVLPIIYWVNEQGRLLLALSGLVGYVYSPDPRL